MKGTMMGTPNSLTAIAGCLAIALAGCTRDSRTEGRAAPEAPNNTLLSPGPARNLILDLGGGATLECVLVPAGKFMMGSPASEEGRGDDEGPRRQVAISRPFYMGIYEVTQEQYQAVMGESPDDFEDAKLPVGRTSWDDAVEFCRKLSQRTGRTVRLPTEAEWEYACRAGTTTPFNTGETISTDQANYGGDHVYGSGRKGLNRQAAVPVGTFKPNAWGLYDMHGNVFEWCADWYADSYAGAKNQDPQGPSSGTLRVYRGGRWGYSPRFCRSASRFRYAPGIRGFNYGFRAVVSLD